MDVAEVVKKADEFFLAKQPYLAFKLYLDVISYYRKNKKRIKVTDVILTAYNNAIVLGFYLADSRNKLIEIRDLALEFLKVAKKSKDSEVYAQACFHAGVAHNALGEYDKSVKLLEEALVIFEILGNDEGVMLACRNLAEAYENLGLKSKAEVYRSRAEVLARRLGESGRSAMSEAEWLFKKWKSVPWVIFR